MDKTYIAIDLKSFYASVECVERGLDPLTTALVVTDESRSAKTICLAASPAIKAFGVPGRARLFEIVQKVKAANRIRQAKAPKHIRHGHRSKENAHDGHGWPSAGAGAGRADFALADGHGWPSAGAGA